MANRYRKHVILQPVQLNANGRWKWFANSIDEDKIELHQMHRIVIDRDLDWTYR